MRLPSSLIGGLEASLNRLLETDPASEARLQPLAGQRIRIHINELDMGIDFLPSNRRIIVQSATGEPAKLEMTGGVAAFARAALAPDSAGPGKGVEIRGDADLARRFAELLQDADVDFEAILSDWVGDSAARFLGQGLQAVFGFGQKNLKAFGQDSLSYLRDDSGDVVSAAEASDWMGEVESLRDDTERLEVRLNRLSRNPAFEKSTS